MHITALEHHTSAAEYSERPMVVDAPNDTPITLNSLPSLTFLDCILEETSNDEPMDPPVETFDDVILDEVTGMYVDNFGDPIEFSAGQHDAQATARERHLLSTQHSYLSLLQSHSSFGQFDVEDEDDVAEGQLDTVTQLERAIEALGEIL
jgi:hypothetical protein